jgi:flavin reductase (DIM6/NTAB) family NADH-FMN oxidoreductase RutF
MSLDLAAANYTMQGLKPIPVAITTNDGGRLNGLVSLSAAAGGIIPEAPRMTISITKYNHTHDMIVNSGVFCMHLLSNDPEQMDASLNILMTLGGSSGRDGDKISGLATKEGVTGCPILLDALAYAECRVVNSMDCEENTLFLADIVAAERLRKGGKLNVGEAWAKLPPEWIATYDANHEPQLNHCREMRGLPIPEHGGH